MLTEKQIEILKDIYLYIQVNGISPTVRNLCDLVDLRSSAAGHGYINALESRGYITRKKMMY